MLRRPGTQVRQYLFHFRFFLDLQFPQPVIKFHHGSRLYEKGGTCGGLVMDHTVHLSLVLRFYRNTVSVIPHGDHRVLQIAAVGTGNHGIKLAADLFVGEQHGAAYMFQPGAGIVRHLFF